MSRRMILVALLLLLVAPVSGTQVTAQAVDVPFLLTFVPNIQFSPLYVADAKGYYADAGLSLSVQYGDEPDGVDLIAADQIKFGMISGEQVIQARANGRPVVYVYEWFQQYPVGVVVPADSGIDSADALAGQRVGIPGRFGASYTGLTALLSSAGLSESDVQLEPIGFNAPDVFCLGQLDASVIYVNNEPLQIQQRAEAGECGDVQGVDVIPVASVADMVSNGIVTNADTIANNAELVQAVVGAFDRGLRDVIQNPAEAYLFSLDYVENLPASEALIDALAEEAALQNDFLASSPDRAAVRDSRDAMYERLARQFSPDELIQMRVLLETIRLWDTDQLGVTDPQSWVLTEQIMVDMGLATTSVELSAAYTNDFVPAVRAGG